MKNHMNMPQNCVGFLLLSERTLQEKAYRVTVHNVNHAISRHICVILVLNNFRNNIHFRTNSFKHFSQTNSLDPRQRVPLIAFLDQSLTVFDFLCLSRCMQLGLMQIINCQCQVYLGFITTLHKGILYTFPLL